MVDFMNKTLEGKLLYDAEMPVNERIPIPKDQKVLDSIKTIKKGGLE